MTGAMGTTRTTWSDACAGGAIVVFGLVVPAGGFFRTRRPASRYTCPLRAIAAE
jgi:hypothetical protein